MGFFDIFKGGNKVKGIIGKYNLENWWKKNFSEEERKIIISKKPEVVKGDFNEDKSLTQVLYELSMSFNTKKHTKIAEKLLKKAEEDVDNILDLHFTYNQMIKSYYKKRNESDEYFRKAINACERQIAIAEETMKAFGKKHYDDMRTLYEFEVGVSEKDFTFEEYLKEEGHPFRTPSHRGFKQLAIVKHKQGEYKEVIELCKKAKKQGWMGDWDKRIERAQNKLEVD